MQTQTGVEAKKRSLELLPCLAVTFTSSLPRLLVSACHCHVVAERAANDVDLYHLNPFCSLDEDLSSAC